MTENNNNYNRTFDSKASQLLKEKQVETKFSTFKEEVKKDDEGIKKVEDSERYNDPAEDKTKKVNPLLKLVDKISGKEKEAQEKQRYESTYTDVDVVAKDLTIQDIIAPIDLEIDFNDLQIGDYYARTLFISGYPRFVGPNWLSPIVNFEHSLRISTFYYPVDSKTILEKLKKKIGEMEASLYSQMEDRKVVDPSLKVALSDAQQLQDSIAEGTEKFFHFAMYVTIYARNKELLEKYSRNVISTFAAMNVTARPATLQQEPGFISTQPIGVDKLYITRNMDTTSIATTFPFVSSELTMDHGIMYGINLHNKSLVIFDRFELENANTVVFAKSGAGKSYFVKLEAVRSLMLGTEIIIIDPEREYEALCTAVNGSYISFSQDKGNKMNPFELSGVRDEGDDELRMKLLALHGFFKVLFGGLNNTEESILDRALILTYREKGITFDPATQTKKPPLLEDLYKVLKGMAETEAHDLARRMEKYIIGSAAGVFNEESNFEINNPFTVFSVRDLQEELKPLAMYLMLDFIWTRIRKDIKRRLLIVDEAWYMMQSLDSASFMYSIAKRARKYYLGLTTITQDVADFLNNDMGKAIISNSSLQVLMKQSPSAVEKLQQVFNLSDGERNYLLNCDRGQGLFFAGSNHVGIQILSSQAEHELITSDPRDLERKKKMQGMTDTRGIEEMSQIFEPPTQQSSSEEMGNVQRQDQIIKGAIQKRIEDESTIQDERERYKKELEERIKEEEKLLNPQKFKSQQSFLEGLKQDSLSGQVIQSRQDIQKDKQHLTPQGLVESYDKDGQK
ncbi:MAG: Type IV secretory pathway VirB4 component-like protein [candidate division WS6 bacterium GW2011_GWF1_35_23]|uniref:Type IV secretory pathway VirB4 component-like protein n=1 Tax=candidate division WS6 bacterium GW2011_GWF1_35_23 TaxID=1619097 RepID=A0A0G0CN63_9BACT|nr:MAG: Type IV secretory pathway VirB4 component-like protein [candidate division WS6 bacterium GW2011_GWF1_35_23]